MKRLGVLGTFVWDRIWHPEASGDRPVEQWGGIAYSLSAFSAACAPGWTVCPIAKVGADLWDPAVGFVRSLPNLGSLDGLIPVPLPNNRVELRYATPAERTERLTGGVGAWEWAELAPSLGGLDALYVNFISGHELALSTAERLRRELPIPLYADLHSLFLGVATEGPRPPRALPEWERWVAAFDAVQLNDVELRLLAAGSDPLPFLRSLPSRGPLLALVTRGSLGAEYACRLPLPPALEWPEVRAAAAPDPQIQTGGLATSGAVPDGDPTGCGDVWGSVLFAGLLEGMELAFAIHRAHEAAAAKMRDGRMERLAETVSRAVRRIPAG
jgi:hypothetical protein